MAEVFIPQQKASEGGTKGYKKKFGVEANHLLNIQFDRIHSSTGPQHRRRSTKTQHHGHMTKSQFLQANYKFIISPFHDGFDEGFYDPDTLVSWSLVEEVIVPVADSDRDCICPVCLGSAYLPKITRCGHIFCYLCLLQYFGPDERKKCPICADKTSREDLRNVQFTQVSGPEVGKPFTFKLISCERGSLQPRAVSDEALYLHGAPPPSTLSLSRLPSNDLSNDSIFSRVTTASIEYLQDMLLRESSELQQLRLASLDTSQSGRGDTEYLPYIAEALSLNESKSYLLASSIRRQSEESPRGGKSRSNSNLSENEDVPVGLFVTDDEEEMKVPTVSYFFQSAEGELVFLHSVSFKPLLAQAENNFLFLPRLLAAPVLDTETIKVTPSMRTKLPFMHHLPQQCDVVLVELDLRGIVGAEHLKPYVDEINKRAKLRKKKSKALLRDKREDVKEQAQHAILVEDMKQLYRIREEREKAVINELLSGPRVGLPVDVPRLDDHTTTAVEPSSSQWSFARVTQMGGCFPSLSESRESGNSTSVVGSPPIKSAWGSSPCKPQSASVVSSIMEGSVLTDTAAASSVAGNSGSKKKNRGTPLFANTG